MRDVMERLVDLGDKHFFRLRDGSSREGWIMAIEGDEIVFSPAPSPFAIDPPEQRIAIDAVVPGTAEAHIEGRWERVT